MQGRRSQHLPHQSGNPQVFGSRCRLAAPLRRATRGSRARHRVGCRPRHVAGSLGPAGRALQGSRRRDRDAPDEGRAGVGRWGARRRVTPQADTAKSCALSHQEGPCGPCSTRVGVMRPDAEGRSAGQIRRVVVLHGDGEPSSLWVLESSPQSGGGANNLSLRGPRRGGTFSYASIGGCSRPGEVAPSPLASFRRAES
jgi:hypothetical protein